MKYKSLCKTCAEKPELFLPNEVYVIVDKSDCPRCRDKWILRFGLSIWAVMCFGMANTIIYLVKITLNIARNIGLSEAQCISGWAIFFTLFIWYITSILGKWMVKKMGLME